MARRTKRRATTPPRKRPSGAPRPAAGIPEPRVSRVEEPAAVATSPTLQGTPVAPSQPREPSRLPMRGEPAARSAPAPQADAGTAEAPATGSLLPRRDRVVGRAEIRRRQEATLEPLDEGPAVPLDRTPYLPLDIRRVMLVSAVMLLLVIAGLIFVH